MNELNDELESLQARMEQLTAAIDEARAQNVHRDQQQTETLEKITAELDEQTALADAAEEDLAQVDKLFEILPTREFTLSFFSLKKEKSLNIFRTRYHR